ncbi:MAG: exosortase system-associated protein, TIGR04073 family [Candidatus Omnitrophica bacterium]|nr:exosortase system-associated protein, TIGR04073 family [Candidatus Omnitrophota bacterium]MDD5436039.1 exosortase system-associated protein, TIGR04073 family [Candidatus Omnitrophota bacterium]
MAKRAILVGLIVFLFAITFASPGYCDDPIKKLGRGLCNMGTCLFELPLQVSRVNLSDGPMAAGTWGFLKGSSMIVVRLFTGVYEVVTFPFPLPPDYKPIMTDPEFFFEEQNW